jgi:hypothetical protein
MLGGVSGREVGVVSEAVEGPLVGAVGGREAIKLLAATAPSGTRSGRACRWHWAWTAPEDQGSGPCWSLLPVPLLRPRAGWFIANPSFGRRA